MDGGALGVRAGVDECERRLGDRDRRVPVARVPRRLGESSQQLDLVEPGRACGRLHAAPQPAGALEVGPRRLERVHVVGGRRGGDRGVQRRLVLVRALPVLRQRRPFRGPAIALGHGGVQRLRQRGVQRAPPRRQQLGVDRFARQRVAEAVALGGGVADEEVGVDQLLERSAERGLVQAGGALEQLVVDVAAGGGRDVEQLSRRAVHPRHAGEQHVAQRLRQRVLAGDARREQLLREVRVAFGAGVDPFRQRRCVDDGRDLEGGLRGRQPREVEPLSVGASRELGQELAQRRRDVGLVRAQRDHEQQPLPAQVAREEPQRVLGRRVGPVDVLDHEHGGRLLGEPAERAQQQLEQLRRHLRAGGVATLAQLGHQPFELVVLEAAERRDDRRVRELARLQRHALAPQDAMAVGAGPVGQLARHPRLADPGLAGDQHEPRVAGRDLRQRVVECCHRVRAADRQRARDPARHMAIITLGRRSVKWRAGRVRARASRATAARSSASAVRIAASCWERRESMSTSWGGEDDATVVAGGAHRRNCRTGLPYCSTLTQLC